MNHDHDASDKEKINWTEGRIKHRKASLQNKLDMGQQIQDKKQMEMYQKDLINSKKQWEQTIGTVRTPSKQQKPLTE